MDFKNWKYEFDFLYSELEVLGRLSEFDLILELDTSNGIAGAVDKLINLTKQNLSLIEETANKEIYYIIEETRNLNYNEVLKNYINKKKIEIRDFKIKENSSISKGYVAKGINFLVERLGVFLKSVFSPIINRLNKTLIDAIPNAQAFSSEITSLVIITSIINKIMMPISTKSLFGAITPVVSLIYLKSLNLYFK